MIQWLCRTMGIMVVLWAALVPYAHAEGQPPAEGGVLPAITLPVPKDTALQAYLGLAGKKEFTIADIQAEVVIIEVMNMY